MDRPPLVQSHHLKKKTWHYNAFLGLGQIKPNLMKLQECCWLGLGSVPFIISSKNLTTKLYWISKLFLRISNCYIYCHWPVYIGLNWSTWILSQAGQTGDNIWGNVPPLILQVLTKIISPKYAGAAICFLKPEVPARNQCSQDQIAPRNCQGCHLGWKKGSHLHRFEKNSVGQAHLSSGLGRNKTIVVCAL